MSDPIVVPSGPVGKELADQLDEADPLKHLRAEFIIPSKADISRTTLPTTQGKHSPNPFSLHETGEPCTYLVGNSLGLQPRRTAERISQYLATWRTQGVQGHFKPMADSPLPTWLDVDARAARMMAPVVGAQEEEVAVMQTLTANLHFLMAAFYTPRRDGRYKVILESKAFPSDHFVVETQIRHHGLSPEEATVTIEPPGGEDILTTEYVKGVISQHASTAAVLLLPGIQYYSGQLLDIPTITEFARSLDIFVIWDLAHAVGNVPLALHDWDVDAAAWCTYKYLNGGPGCIGGMFVHERNSRVATDTGKKTTHHNRFAGWWGNDKSTRFAMRPGFHPVPGAAGFQLSNPSVLDITSLGASLEVFALAGGMAPLRAKSVLLTGYLLCELRRTPEALAGLWRVITPGDEAQRGAQVSLLLADGMLETVMAELEAGGVLVDERRPNVVRVAPAPLYNTFKDCFDFARAFQRALEVAVSKAAR